jgi:hypothetical protein
MFLLNGTNQRVPMGTYNVHFFLRLLLSIVVIIETLGAFVQWLLFHLDYGYRLTQYPGSWV